MVQKDKKTYSTPLATVLTLCVGTPLAISGDTDGFEDKSAEDDVTYETRRGGWNCENWIDNGESQF